MRRSVQQWRISTTSSPSSATVDGATSSSSFRHSGANLSTGKRKSANCWVSASRPTRSWYFTSWYFWITVAWSTVFDGLKRSLMILNTVLKPGRVNTVITMPRTPGAMTKRSSVPARWLSRARKNSDLPCL
ncbi:hypothetical protein D9M73_185770 [compost metagenome]